jgi:hypothetical protein
LAGFAPGGNQVTVDTIIKLEGHIRELEQKLNDGQGSLELQAKNARLAAMLEKSESLYSNALAQNRALMERLGSRALHLCHFGAIEIEPEAEIMSNAGFMKRAEQRLVLTAYLKSTLIQFFGRDAGTRDGLIPLILELVGCNERQIRTAQRHWERSNQLIHKTTGFFGL